MLTFKVSLIFPGILTLSIHDKPRLCNKKFKLELNSKTKLQVKLIFLTSVFLKSKQNI